ncbi:hypothetical protein ACH4SP_03830 [Streptomyces sp. NPDC021093]|uniref:hypothetical protein n=1 Tax=Streptomyces sp. NPDC021093 TaxID=3365112 RepID=UPI00378D418A
MPNTDTVIDTPADVYDQLQDLRCSDARETVSRHSDGSKPWNLVSGLVSACLAAKGDTAEWAEAGRLYDSLGGPGFVQGKCRETAAYRTLNQAIGWARQNPRGTATLHPVRGGTTACRPSITEVDPAPETTLSPGDFFRVYGTWPQKITGAVLKIDGSTVLGLTPEYSECCHGAQVGFALPEAFEGAGLVDLTLTYQGGTLSKPGVFRIKGTTKSPAEPPPEPPVPGPSTPSPKPSLSPSPSASPLLPSPSEPS